MHNKIPLIFLCFLFLAIGQACISQVKVYKAEADTEGLRYFLPQPFLQVTPRTDGGVDVEVVYLPDLTQEYAIQAKSIFGNYTIDINRSEKGFLETVTFDGDSTGVVKQLIESASAIKVAEIEAKAAAAKIIRDEEKEEEKKVADEESAALVAAEKALNEAELNLDIAKGKKELLENLKGTVGAPEDLEAQILAAQLVEVEAEAKLTSAQEVFETKKADVSAANVPGAKKEALTAPEAVFFRIKMTTDDVELIQAFNQEDRQTWRLPKDKVELPDFAIPFAEGYSRVVRPDKDTKALSFKIKANRSLIRVKGAKLRKEGEKDPLETAHVYSLQEDGKTVIVDLPKDLPKGDYVAEGIFVVGPIAKKEDVTKAIQVRVER